MALFILRKLILQSRMCIHPVGLNVWFLVGPVVYFHTSSVRTAKALARLRGGAGSLVHSLVVFVINTIISCAGSNCLEFINQRGLNEMTRLQEMTNDDMKYIYTEKNLRYTNTKIQYKSRFCHENIHRYLWWCLSKGIRNNLKCDIGIKNYMSWAFKQFWTNTVSKHRETYSKIEKTIWNFIQIIVKICFSCKTTEQKCDHYNERATFECGILHRKPIVKKIKQYEKPLQTRRKNDTLLALKKQYRVQLIIILLPTMTWKGNRRSHCKHFVCTMMIWIS